VSLLLLATVYLFEMQNSEIGLDRLYIAGVAASSKKFREATETDAAGVVFLLFASLKALHIVEVAFALLIGTPPRPRVKGCFATFY